VKTNRRDVVSLTRLLRAGEVTAVWVPDAWSYRYPPRVGRQKQPKVAAAPRRVREIAWKAQTRLCWRFGSLERKDKLRTVL